MTRINSAISPKFLTDQHLLAELRELPRIFTAVKNRLSTNKDFNDIPKNFTLGNGHVKFFYNKCQFLSNRHHSLRLEYFDRYKKHYDFDYQRISSIPDKFFGDYKSTDNEKQLLIDRISTRIMASKQIPRYYGEAITKEVAVNMLMGK